MTEGKGHAFEGVFRDAMNVVSHSANWHTWSNQCIDQYLSVYVNFIKTISVMSYLFRIDTVYNT